MPVWIKGKGDRGRGGRINNYPSPINMTRDSPQDWNVIEKSAWRNAASVGGGGEVAITGLGHHWAWGSEFYIHSLRVKTPELERN